MGVVVCVLWLVSGFLGFSGFWVVCWVGLICLCFYYLLIAV